MICPRCHTNNPQNSERCVACGATLGSMNDTVTLGGGDSPASAPEPVGARPSTASAVATPTPGSASPPSGEPSGLSSFPPGFSPALAPEADFGPRYRIESLLGEGGMGSVYKAYDKELDRTVALKLLRGGLAKDPVAMQRFKQELLLARKISHKNILRTHDLGDVGGVKFISMEFVEGEDLYHVLKREKRLPVDRAVKIARQLCEALAAAHAEGVIHRDLKPQNVLLDRSDTVFVSDFGLAKSLEEGAAGLTRTGDWLGTPQYMSPEQVESKPADHRSDLYALGLILYEMVTGEFPFSSKSITQALLLRVRKKPKDSKLLNPNLPDYLARIIGRCLEPNPDRRYQGANDILQDLGSERAPSLSRSAQISLPMPGSLGWLLGMIAAAALLAAVLVAFPWARNLIHRRTLQTPGTGSSTVAGEEKYLAILPFRVNGDPASLGYRADGLVEALSAKLFQLKTVHLASPSAVERARAKGSLDKIARTLGVSMLIQGTLESSGDKIRVVVNLEDVSAGKRLWSQEFSGVAQDLLTLEDQIYNKLVDALALRPGSEETARAAMHPTENIEAYDSYLRGRNAMHGGKDVKDVQSAIGFYEAALKRDPGFALAYSGLADANLQVYRLQKDSAWADKALAAAQQARRLNENLPEAHFALSTVYNETGKTAEAAAEIKHALELAPNSDEAYRRLGDNYLASGRKDDAVQAYEKAISINPYYWLNDYKLGQAHLHFGDYPKALNAFRRVTELDPENAPGYDNIGIVYFQQGKLNDAIPAFQKALALRPYEITYSNLGVVYLYLKQYQDAVRMFEKAVEMNPNRQVAVGNLADAYRWSGDSKKAVETYNKAIALALKELQVNPRNAATMGSLALYYAKKGDTGQAIQLSRRARAIDPKNVDLVADDAIVLTLAGKSADALKTLKEAFENGYSVQHAKNEPELNALHSHPEFEELVKQFGKN